MIELDSVAVLALFNPITKIIVCDPLEVVWAYAKVLVFNFLGIARLNSHSELRVISTALVEKNSIAKSVNTHCSEVVESVTGSK
jgi:hypothetical protein